jgi:hypothetical protein
VAAHLHREEHAVEHGRQRGHGERLAEGELSDARCVVGQHQRRAGQQDDHRQVGHGPLHVEFLLAMAQAARQQADAHHQVHDDHHHREDRVAPDGRKVARAQQHRGDQDDFDQHDGQREDQRAVGLAQLVGQVVRLAHHAEGRGDDGAEQQDEDAGGDGRGERLREPCAAEEDEEPDHRPRPDQTGPGHAGDEFLRGARCL